VLCSIASAGYKERPERLTHKRVPRSVCLYFLRSFQNMWMRSLHFGSLQASSAHGELPPPLLEQAMSRVGRHFKTWRGENIERFAEAFGTEGT
jgi:hypothetical protein